MPQVINAIYKQGFFHPLEPIFIKEKQTVRILIIAEKTNNDADNDNYYNNIEWLTLPSNKPDVKPVSNKERQRIADILGKASSKPVSEMIIEDRG
ncbi:MAG: hypothetical protein OMM_10669 [Candidatus Magnetoglobus multicellularis str. Araruama]|uniref:DUF104 domain-containing protein n=1 Tax=Candidatus Magnetoglobus multicellularis str. Araruama TaxID=890399 RepID=A0A1V1P0C0_9BACT|nr:MAG: hypothetical protein OMM_10669 [Candidatus Magnetoglobus multicellularis str. Araruama]